MKLLFLMLLKQLGPVVLDIFREWLLKNTSMFAAAPGPSPTDDLIVAECEKQGGDVDACRDICAQLPE